MDTTKGSRVLLIGLDSLDIDYVEPRLGSLPNLKRLFDGGVVRRLDSPGNVMSASVWPTFSTGTTPGGHGQYFPIQWDPDAMKLRHVESNWFESEPFWRTLARQGLAVTTLDVQMAFPNRTPAGLEIINWGADVFGGFHCNQPEVAREIERRFGTNVLGPDVPVDKSARRLERIRRTILEGARRRGELSRWLLSLTPWNLFVTVFTECHRAGHYFWRDPGQPATDNSDDALLEILRAVDDEVGSLLHNVDLRDTSVVVFSLLGMGPNHSQMHLVPAVLDRINASFSLSEIAPSKPARSKPGVMRLLRERLPAPLQERVALAVPERVRDWVIDRAHRGALDWDRTPGFALPTGGEGYVRFNIAGRESQGCLPKSGVLHQRYVDAVREGFRSLREADTGEPVVEEVTVISDKFPGPRSRYLPDLSIAWRSGTPATSVHSEELGSFAGRLKTGRGGNHRAVAFAAVAGPAATSRQAQSMASIVDLAHLTRDLAINRSAPA
jgi:predicted AlkP superfamily phosphohydrolase/phosphomutase